MIKCCFFLFVNVCTPVKKIIFHLKSEEELQDIRVPHVTVVTVSGRLGFSMFIDFVFG